MQKSLQGKKETGADHQRHKGSRTSEHPALSKWSFKEIFSGTSHLTRAFRKNGKFKVEEPFELIHRGKPNPNYNILSDAVFDRLCRAACQPRQLWHFGFPCSSFSILQNLNKGTQTKQQPMGDGSLKREKAGNEIMLRTIHFCKLLHEHGSFFTLENPSTSYAWDTNAMKDFILKRSCSVVPLDQCMYGLTVPDDQGDLGLARKSTLLVGTMPNLNRLECKCNHQRPHVPVVGGVKHEGRWQKRSTLAGSYPSKLCSAYVRAFEKCFA